METSRVATLLALREDESERALIEIYQAPEGCHSGLRGSPAIVLSRWSVLLHKALADHHAGRYYATILTLIAVMDGDGYVATVDQERRRGLHTRFEDDMRASDSVTGHHLGLTNVMPVFTRSIKKVIEESVYELYRHGIVHGMVVDFDNEIVATRAWSYLLP